MADHIYPLFGWGPELFDYPSGDPEEAYQVELPYGDSAPRRSFRVECQINAREITDQARRMGKDIILLVSGGMDSHSMLLSFVLQDLPVTAVVYSVYLAGELLNKPDVERGTEMCKKWDVPCIELKLDISDYKYAPWYATYDYSERKDLGLMLRRLATDQFKSEFVVMVGDVHTIGYMPEQAQDNFVVIFKPLNPTPTPFVLGADGVSCFHQYRRNSMMAYLEDAILSNWGPALKHMYPSFEAATARAGYPPMRGGVKFYETLFKPQIFAQNWPEMQVNPKLTGFEGGQINFCKDEDAIDITTIQLHRSIVIPVHMLLDEMDRHNVYLKSKTTPCDRLVQFKEEQE
jgi:hypothetical protein